MFSPTERASPTGWRRRPTAGPTTRAWRCWTSRPASTRVLTETSTTRPRAGLDGGRPTLVFQPKCAGAGEPLSPSPRAAATPGDLPRRHRSRARDVTRDGRRRLRGELVNRPAEIAVVRPGRQGLPLPHLLQRRRDGEARRSGTVEEMTFAGAGGDGGPDVRRLPARLRREEEVPARAVDPRRPGRHLRRHLRLPLEPARLRRARLRRRDGQLPRLLELRPARGSSRSSARTRTSRSPTS